SDDPRSEEETRNRRGGDEDKLSQSLCVPEKVRDGARGSEGPRYSGPHRQGRSVLVSLCSRRLHIGAVEGGLARTGGRLDGSGGWASGKAACNPRSQTNDGRGRDGRRSALPVCSVELCPCPTCGVFLCRRDPDGHAHIGERQDPQVL